MEFEVSDMFADGRLAGVEYVRRLGEAAVFIDGGEYT
jgi:hypothetical protein